MDQWDNNNTDNTLNVICKPDFNFNVPPANQMPDCLAKCSADKPSPPEENNAYFDTNKTSPTAEMWEGQQIW